MKLLFEPKLTRYFPNRRFVQIGSFEGGPPYAARFLTSLSSPFERRKSHTCLTHVSACLFHVWFRVINESFENDVIIRTTGEKTFRCDICRSILNRRRHFATLFGGRATAANTRCTRQSGISKPSFCYTRNGVFSHTRGGKRFVRPFGVFELSIFSAKNAKKNVVSANTDTPTIVRWVLRFEQRRHRLSCFEHISIDGGCGDTAESNVWRVENLTRYTRLIDPHERCAVEKTATENK